MVLHVELALQKDRGRMQLAGRDKSALFRRGRPMEVRVRHLHDKTIRASSVSLGRPLPERP